MDKPVNIRFYIIMAVIIMATLTVIWGHSMMPAETSSKESGTIFAFLQPVLDFLFGEGLSTEHFIRKVGHFTEFFILGAELMVLFRYLNRRLVRLVTAWAAGTLCGLIDETIQLFSPGRSSEVPDVWLDSAGCLTGVLLAIAVCTLIRRRAVSRKPVDG